MRILPWNVRGLGAGAEVTVIRDFIRNARVNVCFLQESKMEFVYGELISKLWFDDNFEFRFSTAKGRSRGLISIWDKNVSQLSREFFVDRVIVLIGKWKIEGMDATLINVYAPIVVVEQRGFWGVSVVRERVGNN